MKKKSKFFHSSLIKLGIGLGDWTKLKPNEQFLDSIEISSIDTVNFDFLSKEELKHAHNLHYQLSDHISKHLSKDMNVKVELHTVMMTQMNYADFIQSINSNVFQVDMAIPTFGNINVIFGSNLASMMVNRLVGGKGAHSTVDEFNDLERDILHTQFNEITPYFQQVWNDVFDINDASMSLYSGQYNADKRISYREAFVVFTFYLYFGGGELLRFMVAFPTDVLRRLMTAYTQKVKSLYPAIHFKESTLKKIKYDVVAKLGSSKLKMKDLQSLGVGDIVPLSNTIDKPISLVVSDKVNLKVQPCVRNNKISCQVIGIDPEAVIPALLMKEKPLEEADASLSESAVQAAQIIKKKQNNSDELNPEPLAPAVAQVAVPATAADEGQAETTAGDEFLDDESDDSLDDFLDDELANDEEALESDEFEDAIVAGAEQEFEADTQLPEEEPNDAEAQGLETPTQTLDDAFVEEAITDNDALLDELHSGSSDSSDELAEDDELSDALEDSFTATDDDLDDSDDDEKGAHLDSDLSEEVNNDTLDIDDEFDDSDEDLDDDFDDDDEDEDDSEDTTQADEDEDEFDFDDDLFEDLDDN